MRNPLYKCYRTCQIIRSMHQVLNKKNITYRKLTAELQMYVDKDVIRGNSRTLCKGTEKLMILVNKVLEWKAIPTDVVHFCVILKLLWTACLSLFRRCLMSTWSVVEWGIFFHSLCGESTKAFCLMECNMNNKFVYFQSSKCFGFFISWFKFWYLKCLLYFGSHLPEICRFELKLSFESLQKSAKNRVSILVQVG